mmetsp:Transcript_40576/g.79609  ORF Transcript_40576/g.79609 Transcript_40576/m.79609 type:complete len:207 (-) Transcript_40576:1601-2221(-)
MSRDGIFLEKGQGFANACFKRCTMDSSISFFSPQGNLNCWHMWHRTAWAFSCFKQDSKFRPVVSAWLTMEADAQPETRRCFTRCWSFCAASKAKFLRMKPRESVQQLSAVQREIANCPEIFSSQTAGQLELSDFSSETFSSMKSLCWGSSGLWACKALKGFPGSLNVPEESPSRQKTSNRDCPRMRGAIPSRICRVLGLISLPYCS